MKIGKSLLAIAAAAMLAPAAWAAQPARQAAPSRRASPVANRQENGVRQVSGRVQSIDHSKQRLTIETQSEPVILDVDRSTTIFINGRYATLTELNTGMDVQASWEVRRGANRAQWVEVKLPPPQELPPEPVAPAAVMPPAPPPPQPPHG